MQGFSYKNKWMVCESHVLWAKFFDSIGIEWKYKFEPFYFDKEKTDYTVIDFYLPRQNIYFQAESSVITDNCIKEYNRLSCNANKTVVIGDLIGRFQVIERIDSVSTVYTKSDSVLFRCLKCFHYWFGNSPGKWDCKICGAYDGDHYISEMIIGNENIKWVM